MTLRMLLFLPSCLCALTVSAAANDWPQWDGPNRNNVSTETGLRKHWPKDGPRLLWTFENAGQGYSGPAVVGDRLYILGSEENSECIFALDVKSGEKLWSCPIGPLFHNGYGNGPRSTPSLDGKLLYALGGQGNLVCVETATGKKRWQVSLETDLKGKMMSDWGWSQSPLVDGDHLIICPGGKQGGIAALDKMTGKVVWRCKELTDKATYASAVPAEIDGVRTYVVTTQRGYDREKKKDMGAIVGVGAKDGKLLWYYPREDYKVAVVPTPIARGNLVYATAGYNAGCDLLQINKKEDTFQAEQLYSKKSRRTMESKHFGVVLVGDYVYGYSDHGGWTCQNFKTGDAVWQDRVQVPAGSVTYADGCMYCYGQGKGEVSLVPASPSGLKVEGKFQIPRTTNVPRGSGGIWTHPVVANGRLFLRDQNLLFCYDVRDGRVGKR